MSTMRYLTYILVMLLVLGTALQQTLLQRSDPSLYSGTISLASLSESGLRVPEAEAQEVFAAARDRMNQRNETGALFEWIATGASWFNILCSILITIALGWAGKSVTPGDRPTDAQLVGLTPAWARTIGFAAALAGASAYAGNEAGQYAQGRYGAAEELQTRIAETRTELPMLPDEASQRALLDKLALEAQRP